MLTVLFGSVEKYEMARTPTVSDQVILEAAGEVMYQRGIDGFTLAEVAKVVGLSRAALILRFTSTQALKVTLLKQMVERFTALLDGLPSTPSGDSLLAFAAFIGRHANTRTSSASFWAVHHSNLNDPELAALEIERGAVVKRVIARMMPPTRIDHASAVAAFNAHIGGTMLAMLAEEGAEPYEYLVTRTKEWLRLADIPFNDLPEQFASNERASIERVSNKPDSKKPGSKKSGANKKAAAFDP